MTDTGEKTPFYNEAGQINDKDIAHDVAIVADKEGMGKAVAREQELKRQHETGMTEQEEKNRDVMEGLIKKYPDAFVVMTTPAGRRVAILNEGDVKRRLNYREKEVFGENVEGRNNNYEQFSGITYFVENSTLVLSERGMTIVSRIKSPAFIGEIEADNGRMDTVFDKLTLNEQVVKGKNGPVEYTGGITVGIYNCEVYNYTMGVGEISERGGSGLMAQFKNGVLEPVQMLNAFKRNQEERAKRKPDAEALLAEL